MHKNWTLFRINEARRWLSYSQKRSKKMSYETVFFFFFQTNGSFELTKIDISQMIPFIEHTYIISSTRIGETYCKTPNNFFSFDFLFVCA
jgi:hypothetical protein